MIYNFTINDFEGPLDLLLHLIKSSKMDIYDINIESITSQYLEFINQEHNLSVDDESEYLVMAAELIHLKSKLLLNIHDEEESDYEINSKEELTNRLLEYQKIKDITNSFAHLEDLRSNIFTKLPSDLSEYKSDDTKLDPNIDLDDLINAFELFLKREKLSKPIETTITRKELSVKERTYQIRNMLKINKKVNFIDLFDTLTKPYVVVTFLSLLEMSKNKEIVINQKINCGEIIIESR